MYIVVGLKIEQSDHVVTSSESFVMMEFVLKYPFVKIATNSDIQSTRQASHDVDAVIAWVTHKIMIREDCFTPR